MKGDKTNTPDEIIDIVNKNDDVIGEATKKIANSNPDIIHREIAILIHDNDNKILIQKRSLKKTIDPGLWQISVAGHVPKGFHPLEAAHMELKEELGFDTELAFINKLLLRYDNETHFAYIYYGFYNGQIIDFEKAEIEKVKFISSEEFKKMQKAGYKFERYSVKLMLNYWRSNN